MPVFRKILRCCKCKQLAASDKEDTSDQTSSLESDKWKDHSRATVLGLWKKLWFAGGALNDVGFAHFNAGGTELINDVGALNAGNNFCIGAWKQVGERSYELVHPFFVFDDSGKNAIGVAIEKSQLTVSRDGSTFRGTWTQDNYDLLGNLVPGHHFDGRIVGTRITPGPLFPFHSRSDLQRNASHRVVTGGGCMVTGGSTARMQRTNAMGT